MSFLSYIGLIGGVCSLVGYVPYALQVLRAPKGSTVAPERASWVIWTLSSTLILLSYWQIGARTTIWVPLAYVVGSAFITILAFTHGREGWGTLEKLALIIALISSIRWVFFDDPILALVLNLAIGFMGYLPGIARLASDPARRAPAELEGWTLFFLGSILNLVAVSAWTIEIAMVPVVLFLMNGATFALTLRNAMIQERQGPPTS
ncbi:MAG: hypothetical protein KGI79_00160 [Patescibacteria group bacterium]|nr:hypothetical protein [Patescibacteria group bacterium]MDE2116284.1 hypothetical protein [Patescibacteria group bacterium]